MYLKWTLFKEYCKTNNIQLLKDDLSFIERTLIKIAPELHRTVLKQYTDIWLSEYKKVENSIQNQNLPRRIANSWLLKECNYLNNKKGT